MTESTYEVGVEGQAMTDTVTADKFEIEAGGTLVFYEQQEPNNLANMSMEPTLAYSNWTVVEKE